MKCTRQQTDTYRYNVNVISSLGYKSFYYAYKIVAIKTEINLLISHKSGRSEYIIKVII